MARKQQVLTIPEMKTRIEEIDGMLNLMREGIPAQAQKAADDMTIINLADARDLIQQACELLVERKNLYMRLELAELEQKLAQ